VSKRIPDEESRFTAVYKIVTLGEPAVGKTSLVTKYVTGRFERDYRRTLGIDISTYDARLDKHLFKLLIWDLAGQDIFVDLRTRYCQGASGGIVVFDITRPQTFEAVSNWVKSFRDSVGEDAILFLLGNKADLEKSRKVSAEQGKAMAKKLKLHTYSETSAKTGHQVTHCFNSLARLMFEAGQEMSSRP
jgi:Ras-related protein Rab-6A